MLDAPHFSEGEYVTNATKQTTALISGSSAQGSMFFVVDATGIYKSQQVPYTLNNSIMALNQLTKYDINTLTQKWTRQIRIDNYNTYAKDIVVTADGTVFMVAGAQNHQPNYGLIYRINGSSGAVEWTRSVVGSYYNNYYNSIYINGNDIYSVGNLYPNMVIEKLSATTGAVAWTKFPAGLNAFKISYYNGRLFILTSESTAYVDSYISEFSPADGSLLANTLVTSIVPATASTGQDRSVSYCETKVGVDGKVVIAGNMNYVVSGVNHNIGAIKIIDFNNRSTDIVMASEAAYMQGAPLRGADGTIITDERRVATGYIYNILQYSISNICKVTATKPAGWQALVDDGSFSAQLGQSLRVNINLLRADAGLSAIAAGDYSSFDGQALQELEAGVAEVYTMCGAMAPQMFTDASGVFTFDGGGIGRMIAAVNGAP